MLTGGACYTANLSNQIKVKENDTLQVIKERDDLETALIDLSKKKQELVEKTTLDEKQIADLQKNVKEKDEALKSQDEEIQRLGEQLAAEEQTDKELEAQKAAENVKASEASEVKKADNETALKNDSNDIIVEESSASGDVMYMESTAYSSDPADLLGGGTVTATGQNLLVNPMAVAVDPNVIPLGSLVHVEGYGQAIASDTGGAIKGNIVDVHFPTASQCISWGRRQVKVTVLRWG